MTKKPKIPKRVSRAIDRMQTTASKAGVDALFAATSEQLGAAAVEGAKRARKKRTTKQAAAITQVRQAFGPMIPNAETRAAMAEADAIVQTHQAFSGPGTPDYIQVVVEQQAEQTLLAWKHRRTIGLEGLSPEDRRAEEERLASEPSSAKRLIGKAVMVKENIPTWIYAGGWGDGPGWLNKGAQVWLEVESDGLLDYVNGPQPPGPDEHRGGGFFPASYLSHCEDL